METNKIIEKYLKRIMVDYPEEDKIYLDLTQFANEIQQVKNLNIPAVIKSVCLLCDGKVNVLDKKVSYEQVERLNAL